MYLGAISKSFLLIRHKLLWLLLTQLFENLGYFLFQHLVTLDTFRTFWFVPGVNFDAEVVP